MNNIATARPVGSIAYEIYEYIWDTPTDFRKKDTPYKDEKEGNVSLLEMLFF